MLRVYAGRENIDKERFIYSNITGEAIVIVPNQYTLVAEEQALRITGRDCLFDIEIMSMNRLGLRLLAEQGRESVRMLDRFGRFMLLTKIIREHMDEFELFRRSAGKQSFTNMLSDFISEFRQNECTHRKAAEMLDDEAADPILRSKLREVMNVMDAYEEATADKYMDSEEYIDDYIGAIAGSAMLKGKTIWIYGYDSITPKFARACLKLAKAADSVSFIINRSGEFLGESIEAMFRRSCSEQGIDFSCEEIGREYELSKSATVRAIEKGLFANVPEPAGFAPEDLTVVCAANPYYEAESAAAYIWHLVRDLGYRMREIQVIANDEGSMHPIIKRVFGEYGLPVFMDSARDITDTAPVSFIVNLLWFMIYNSNSQYLFAMLKTGLAGVPDELTEDLENYARSYHIRGTMWDRDFRYGEEALGTRSFNELNGLRAEISAKTGRLRDLASDPDMCVRDFVSGLRDYLEDIWELSREVQKMADEEEAAGLIDESQRTVESYNKAMEMLGQITEIMGDTVLDLTEFTEIYVAGLTNVEVGVIPPAADGLSVGTMIRTRPRPIRAAVVLGANEGTLPMQPSPEGLFSVDETRYFEEQGFELGALRKIRQSEENAAMYRMMSKPSEKLYISWSLTDSDGNEALQSSVIDSLMMLFPEAKVRKDVVSAGWSSSLINTPEESMRHLIDRIKDRNAPDEPDPLTRAMIAWYDAKRTGELRRMLAAAADENEPAPLGRKIAQKLFGRSDGSLVLSASSISGYFECPFRYYVERGLRPREERDFSSDPRSIGDAYHECLMSVARRLLGDREILSAVAGIRKARAEGEDEASGADEDVYALIEKMVDEELSRIASEYQGGLFVSAGSERYRMDRIREICTGAARAMADQLSADSVLDAVFEEDFGRRGMFEPVTLEIGGQKVYVEGKIDRSDILDVDGQKRVRIIDYKTGSDSLNVWKMRNGYKMQLMIYMISASSRDLEPAGLFYFNIKDPIEGIDNKSAKAAAAVADRQPGDTYKLRGRFIDDPGVLEAMPAEMLTGGRSEKDRRISREDYESLRHDVLQRIEETAEGILKGDIGIHPFKDGGRLACTYCSYKPVCRRDREYTRNTAREIGPEPKEEKEQDN
ncbi:MAG: PD-(D/E)XK nuclease family protein [Mogibacterium sp.]|nr:PD-(D/E)XK nuclease family protein [Mogibacterium sp.]